MFSLSLNKIFRDIEISRWLLSKETVFIVRHCCSSSLLDPRIPNLSSGFPLVIPPNSLSTTKAVTLSFSTPYKQERLYYKWKEFSLFNKSYPPFQYTFVFWENTISTYCLIYLNDTVKEQQSSFNKHVSLMYEHLSSM